MKVAKELNDAGWSSQAGTDKGKAIAKEKAIELNASLPGGSAREGLRTFVDEKSKGASTKDAAVSGLEQGLKQVPFANVESDIERAKSAYEKGDYVAAAGEAARATRHFTREVRDYTLMLEGAASSGSRPGVEVPKAPEAAKVESVRAPEAAKVEAPKVPEAAKAEAPKAPEAAKVEAPKVPEAAKAEAPKAPEAAKVEAPKAPEAAKVEAPKAPEAAKAEALRASEASTVDAPTAPEAAKYEAPEAHSTSSEGPMLDTVRTPRAAESPVEARPGEGAQSAFEETFTSATAAKASMAASAEAGSAVESRVAGSEAESAGSTQADIAAVLEEETRPSSKGVPEEARLRQEPPEVDLNDPNLDEPGAIPELEKPPANWEPPPGWRGPGGVRGEWSGGLGESRWTPHDPGSYGLERGQSVPFREGVPDFSEVATPLPSGEPGTLDVPGLTGGSGDYQLAIEKIAQNQGMTTKEVARWLTENDLRLHHFGGAEVQVVPGRLHDALAHQGAASELRGTAPSW